MLDFLLPIVILCHQSIGLRPCHGLRQTSLRQSSKLDQIYTRREKSDLLDQLHRNDVHAVADDSFRKWGSQIESSNQHVHEPSNQQGMYFHPWFSNGPLPAFLIIVALFITFLPNLILEFNGIWTRIIGLEGNSPIV